MAQDLTTNPELAAALSAQWGDFGGRPSTASFALHALVVGSYLESGAWYPSGGASAIAEHLLPTITSAGGVYPTGDTDVVWTHAPNGEPPGMYVSFASLKDPAHDPGPEGKHVGEVLAWTDWSTVERWANLPPGKRGDDYKDFKARAEAAVFDAFRRYFPRLAELVVFRELATPLATAAITGHTKGAFYGLEVTPDRMLSDALRMKTPVKGLYLTGQDVVSPGIPGAMWGGLLCAASIDPKVFAHLGG